MPLHPVMCLRALRYEERIKWSPNPLLKEALLFQRERADRRVVIESAGWNREEELGRWLQGGEKWTEASDRVYEVTRRSIRQEAEQREYGRIMPTEMPAYLALGIEIKVMARFRCGSEERGTDSWRTEKERMCRIW